MALNIPMPDLPGNSLLKGIDTGSTLFSRIMQPQLQRERQKQLAQQFEQEMALKKAQFARSGSNLDLQRAILGQQLEHLKHANDPMYEFNQFKALQNMMTGGDQGAPQGQMMAQAPSEEMGQGLGAYSPEGLQDAQNTQPEAPANNALNSSNNDMLGAMRQNPLLRGFFKHKFGYDPLSETPEEKNQAYINKAISIDEAKANHKKIDEIEKTAQALLPYIGKVNTIEDILKRKPDLVGPTTQLADFLGMSKDTDVGTFLSAAQALQAHMAKEMSSRGGYGVSKLVEQAKPNIGKSTAYNQGVIKELKQSMKESFEQMKAEYERLSNKKFPYNFEQYFNELVPMISPRGKRVMIPKNQVNAALASGGNLG